MLKAGNDTFAIMDELRAIYGNYVSTIGYRFAAVTPQRPGAWTWTANTRNANGSGTRQVDLSVTTDQMFVQFALAGKTTDGSLGGGYVVLLPGSDGKSRIIGAATYDIQATVNTGESQYLTIGGPFFSLGLTKMMWAFVFSGVGGTVVYAPVWRTYGSTEDAPDAWSSDLATARSITADEAHNFGNLTTSPGTTKLLSQAGVRVGGTSGRGKLQVIVAGTF